MMKRNAMVIMAAVAAMLMIGACSKKENSAQADYIGIDAAKEAALKSAGAQAGDVNFSSAGLDNKDGTFYYEVIFTEDGVEYDYAVDALTGVIIEEKRTDKEGKDQNIQAASGTAPAVPENQELALSSPSQENFSGQEQTGGAVDEAQARAIALSHAQVPEGSEALMEIKRDFDDGIELFEVEFYAGNTKYEYEIRVSDGSILSYNFETHSSQIQDGASGMIPESQAKETVLMRVPGAKAEDIMIYLEEDDGRMEYTGRLIYDNIKYKFEIDAYSGELQEWEAEVLLPR